jgi:hypothetical protein
MRSRSKGSIYRRLAMVMLAIVVIGLVAVPVAAAPSPKMFLAGEVGARYYGGERQIAATVTVPDPSAPAGSPLATTRANAHGFFIMTVPFTGLPQYYSEFTVRATALSPHGNDWSKLFSTGTASFEFTAGGAAGVCIDLVVKNTTVRGTVKNATTRKALSGVTVTVDNKSARTSATGKYSIVIGLWPATKYWVTFSKIGFTPVRSLFTSAPGSTVGVNAFLKKR